MKSWERDEHTHFALIARFFRMAERVDPAHRQLQEELERYMRVRLSRRLWIPEDITQFHSEWYREFYRVLGVEDPYKELKRRSTKFAKEVIEEVKLDSFREVVLAAALANKLDFGAALDMDDGTGLPLTHSEFNHIGELQLFVDDVDLLLERASKASRILYLPDNCGEVVFDSLLIRRIAQLNPNCVFSVAAKARPMINDVTVEELAELEFDPSVELLSTGTNSFGAPESEVSLSFARAFEDADLVVAKGQAHLEFWVRYHESRVMHIACTKFPIQDCALGLIPEAVLLVMSAERYGGDKPRYRPQVLRR